MTIENNNGADRAWLTRLVRWAFECRHQWETIGVNGFYAPIEQQCQKCGVAYRHRILKAERLGLEDEWSPGKHPKHNE